MFFNWHVQWTWLSMRFLSVMTPQAYTGLRWVNTQLLLTLAINDNKRHLCAWLWFKGKVIDSLSWLVLPVVNKGCTYTHHNRVSLSVCCLESQTSLIKTSHRCIKVSSMNTVYYWFRLLLESTTGFQENRYLWYRLQPCLTPGHLSVGW